MISEILGAGEENALSPGYLRSVLKLSSVRALQKQVEIERAQGAVILSSTVPPGGYYLPKNATEIKRFIQTLENRADNTLVALKSARKLLDEWEGINE